MKIRATVIRSVNLNMNVPKPKNGRKYSDDEVTKIKTLIKLEAEGHFNCQDSIIHACSEPELEE